MISACGKLKEAGRAFILFCLGDGPVRSEAEALVKGLDLVQSVRFTGHISEAETMAFHANSTIFVFPTYHDEGFPLVLLKSLAAGLPVITTRIRAAADQMRDPQNCLWVEPRDSRGLADAITRLLDDSETRSKMSENNRRLAEQFSPANVAAEYLTLYKTLTKTDSK